MIIPFPIPINTSLEPWLWWTIFGSFTGFLCLAFLAAVLLWNRL